MPGTPKSQFLQAGSALPGSKIISQVAARDKPQNPIESQTQDSKVKNIHNNTTTNNNKILKTSDGRYYYLQTNGTLRHCTFNDGKMQVGGIVSADQVRNLTRPVSTPTNSTSTNIRVIRTQPQKAQGQQQRPLQGQQPVPSGQSIKGEQQGGELEKGGVAPKSCITPSGQPQSSKTMPFLQGCGDSDKNERSSPGKIRTGQSTNPTASLKVGQEYRLDYADGTTQNATWDGSNFMFKGSVSAGINTPKPDGKGDRNTQQVQQKVTNLGQTWPSRSLRVSQTHSPKQVTSAPTQGRRWLHSSVNEQQSRSVQSEPAKDQRQVAVEVNSNDKVKTPVNQKPCSTPGVKRKPTEEGKYAVCPSCGQLSSDYNTCEECHKVLPEELRYYKPSHSKYARLEETGNNQETAVISRAPNHVSRPSTQLLNRKSYGDQSGTVFTTTTTPPADAPYKRPSVIVMLDSWSIRIGSLKGLPYEKVVMSHIGIDLKMEYKEETLELRIGFDEIVKVIAHFGPNLPLLFVYTSSQCAARVRDLFKMTTQDGPYFDPTSKDATHRRITILMDSVTQKQVHQICEVCRQMQEKPGSATHQLLRKVGSDEAKNLLHLGTSTVTAASGSLDLATDPQWSDEEDVDETGYDWSEWKDAYENVHNSPLLPISPNLATSKAKTEIEPIHEKGSNGTSKDTASDPLTTTQTTETNAEVKESAISGSSKGQPSAGELASFVREIRTTYKGSPHIVSGFLCLLRDFISKRITRDVLVNQSRNLFYKNPHIIEGLRLFKPKDTDQFTEEGQPNECDEHEDEGMEETDTDHPDSPATPLEEPVPNEKALDAEVAEIMNQSQIANTEMPLQLQRICKRIQAEMEEVNQMGYTLVTLVAKRDSAPTMLGFPTGVYMLGDDEDAYPSLMKILRRT